MLYVLIFVNFIVFIQTCAEESLAFSPEALTGAIEQATEVQRETSKLLNGKLVKNFFAHDFFAHDFLESQHSQKGCPSQGLKGSADPVKGCGKNTTPPIPENASLPGGSIPRENTDRILVFVSFSMPEASLKSLAQDATKHNAVLIMRGLFEDSFVKTASKLKDLGIGVDINPELFESHQITAVPTFLSLQSGKPTWRLKGNVTLGFVAKKLNDQTAGELQNREQTS